MKPRWPDVENFLLAEAEVKLIRLNKKNINELLRQSCGLSHQAPKCAVAPQNAPHVFAYVRPFRSRRWLQFKSLCDSSFKNFSS